MGIGDMLQAQIDAEDAKRYRFIRQDESDLDGEYEVIFVELWSQLIEKGRTKKIMDSLIDDAMRRASQATSTGVE